MIRLERLAPPLLSTQALRAGPAVQLHAGLEFFTLLDSNVDVSDAGGWKTRPLLSLRILQCKPPHTWTLDAIAEVVCKIVDNVQQEGEVSYVVHVDDIWVCSDGLQLIFVSILNT